MGNRLILRLFAAAALTMVLTACGGSDDETTSETTQAPQATAAAATSAPTSPPAAAATPAAPQTIEIKAGDYFYEPNALRARPGAIVVKMANEGPERPHTLTVKTLSGAGDLVRSDRVAVGQTGTVELNLTEEGTYQLYCNLPGHADRGQTGTLTVSRS